MRWCCRPPGSGCSGSLGDGGSAFLCRSVVRVEPAVSSVSRPGWQAARGSRERSLAGRGGGLSPSKQHPWQREKGPGVTNACSLPTPAARLVEVRLLGFRASAQPNPLLGKKHRACSKRRGRKARRSPARSQTQEHQADMPTGRNSLKALSHFTDEETDSENLSDLTKATAD